MECELIYDLHLYDQDWVHIEVEILTASFMRKDYIYIQTTVDGQNILEKYELFIKNALQYVPHLRIYKCIYISTAQNFA